jgi:hypothetical protein
MVEQAHLYFRAAVSAAVLNAMAIGGFVLFMALSSVHGWPLRSLLGLADSGAAPAAATRATNVSPTNVGRSLGQAGGFGAFSLPHSHSAAGPGNGSAGPSGDSKLSGDPSSGGASTPGGAPSGTSGPGGPAAGPIQTPDLPSTLTPSTPPPLSTPQISPTVGGSVSNLPTAVGDTVDSTVSGVALGGSSSTDVGGVTGTVQGATGTVQGAIGTVQGTIGTIQGTTSSLVGPSAPVG